MSTFYYFYRDATVTIMKTKLCTMFLCFFLLSTKIFAQLSLIKKNCTGCDCITYTITNTSPDSVYFITALSGVTDSCLLSDATVEIDSIENRLTIDLSRNATASFERGYWVCINHLCGIQYNIKKTSSPFNKSAVRIYVKAFKPKKFRKKYKAKKIATINCSYRILPIE